MNDTSAANPSAAPSDNACCKPTGGSGGKCFAGGLIVGVIAGLFGGVFLGPILESWGNKPEMPAATPGGPRTPPPSARTPTESSGGPSEGEQRPAAATGAPTGNP